MDKVNKQELRRLAEKATPAYGPRYVEIDHNHRIEVIGDGSWKIFSAWHTPDGNALNNANLAAACTPSAILSLLDELERLERDNSSLRQDVRNAFDDDLKLATMRDQEAAIMKLEQYRKDALRYRWLRNEANNCPSQAPAVVMLNADCKPAWDVLGSAHRSLVYGNHLDAAVDDLLAKEGGANG